MITFHDKLDGVIIIDTVKQDTIFVSRDSFSLRMMEKSSPQRIEVFGDIRNNNSFLKGVELTEFDPSLGLGTISEAFEYLKPFKEKTPIGGTIAHSLDIYNLTAKTIWDYAGTEDHPFRPITGETVSISSDSPFDVGHQVTVRIGVGGDGKFKTEVVTLNGQNKVTLSGTWLSTGLVQVIGPAPQGNIYVYKDGAITAGVPNTTSDVMQYLPIGTQLSAPGNIAVPTDRRFVVDWISMASSSSSVTSIVIEFNVIGQSYGWVKQLQTSINFNDRINGGNSPIVLDPGLQYRFTAIDASGSNVEVSMAVSLTELTV